VRAFRCLPRRSGGVHEEAVDGPEEIERLSHLFESQLEEQHFARLAFIQFSPDEIVVVTAVLGGVCVSPCGAAVLFAARGLTVTHRMFALYVLNMNAPFARTCVPSFEGHVI
jgi:hypothetical protein